LGRETDCGVMNFEMLRFCICKEESVRRGCLRYLSGRGVT
jgi:hypothetical protein